MRQQNKTVPTGFRGDMANGFNPNDTSHLTADDLDHIARRQRLLGPAYRLFTGPRSRSPGLKAYFSMTNTATNISMPITTLLPWGIRIRALSTRSRSSLKRCAPTPAICRINFSIMRKC